MKLITIKTVDLRFVEPWAWTLAALRGWWSVTDWRRVKRWHCPSPSRVCTKWGPFVIVRRLSSNPLPELSREVH